MILSFALAFLVGATFGRHLNVAALAIVCVLALAATTAFVGFVAGLLALIGLQAGYLAGHAAFTMQESAAVTDPRRSGPSA